MSQFYGTLQGGRGLSTRCGTRTSGITTVAASWKGAIEVIVSYNSHLETDCYRIYRIPWKGRGKSVLIAEGIFD